MPVNTEDFMIAQINNTRVETDPYPHFYTEPIFPEETYKELMKSLPSSSVFTKTSPEYDNRFMLSLHNPEEIEQLDMNIRGFWVDFSKVLLSKKLMNAFIAKFKNHVDERFKEFSPDFFSTVDLVVDKRNYALGPHTDHPDKVISIIFYLPKSADMPGLGTKVYIPDDPNFKDFAGEHFKFEGFKKIKGVDYKPNALFCFFKTDNSFHGVEQVSTAVERCLIMYNIRIPVDQVDPLYSAHVHGPL